jgi:hypothetical protein
LISYHIHPTKIKGLNPFVVQVNSDKNAFFASFNLNRLR